MAELESRTGLNRQTIHYYLRKGYLHPAIYKEGKQAFYDQTHAEKLVYLKEARDEGIPLQIAVQLWEHKGGKKNPARHYGAEGSPTRGQIIEAASKIFLRKGYHQTTISDVVESVGVTKAAFYYYFENKKDLYFSCIDIIFRSFFERSLSEIENETAPSRRWELRWDFYKDFFPEMFTILQLIKESLRDEDEQHRQKAEQALCKGFVGPLINDINIGIEAGILRPVNSELAAFALLSTFELMAYRSLFTSSCTDEQIQQAVFDLILHGFFLNSGDDAGSDAS